MRNFFLVLIVTLLVSVAACMQEVADKPQAKLDPVSQQAPPKDMDVELYESELDSSDLDDLDSGFSDIENI